MVKGAWRKSCIKKKKTRERESVDESKKKRKKKDCAKLDEGVSEAEMLQIGMKKNKESRR